MITLNEKELNILERYEKGEIELPTGEDKEVFMGIIDKASALERELDAYDESDGDLIAWYYNKYKAQQGE